MTVTIELQDREANFVRDQAIARGLAVQDYVQERFRETIRQEQAFEVATDYVLKKNDELYQRLAK